MNFFWQRGFDGFLQTFVICSIFLVYVFEIFILYFLYFCISETHLFLCLLNSFWSLLFFQKRFLNLLLFMIALEISLLMKGLWLYCIYRFFLGTCLSKISVQIVEKASSPFSFRNCPCTRSSCFNESKKISLWKSLWKGLHAGQNVCLKVH